MRVCLSDTIALPVPKADSARYRSAIGKDLIFGLRPEHITEPRRGECDGNREFTVTLDVVEPMGMETMVYFALGGVEICGRVDPASAVPPGQLMRVYANVDHMHLIDPESGLVL
jgi:multiple sugar transport system ATP-binding protein